MANLFHVFTVLSLIFITIEICTLFREFFLEYININFPEVFMSVKFFEKRKILTTILIHIMHYSYFISTSPNLCSSLEQAALFEMLENNGKLLVTSICQEASQLIGVLDSYIIPCAVGYSVSLHLESN